MRDKKVAGEQRGEPTKSDGDVSRERSEGKEAGHWRWDDLTVLTLNLKGHAWKKKKLSGRNSKGHRRCNQEKIFVSLHLGSSRTRSA